MSHDIRPIVTIITVVLNGERHLEKTIKSVIHQTYGNIEYIIIDGGSTDGTIDIIKKHEDEIDCWLSEKDHGIYDAMNKGIRLANGALIGMVNCGDWLKIDAVSQVIEMIKERIGEKFIVSGGMDKVDEKGNHLFTIIRSEDILKKRFQMMPLNHGATFISMPAYSRYGLYDTTYRIAGDYELVLRMIELGVKLYFIDSVLSYMRAGGVSDARGIDLTIIKEHYLLIVKYTGRLKALFIISRNCFFTLIKRLIPKVFLYKLWHLRHAKKNDGYVPRNGAL